MLATRARKCGRPDPACAHAAECLAARTDISENFSARGGYTLHPQGGNGKPVVIIATGSEVEIAVGAAKLLGEQGISASVVSMPSVKRFLAQDAAYQASVLPAGALRVSLEAGTTFGWQAYHRA